MKKATTVVAPVDANPAPTRIAVSSRRPAPRLCQKPAGRLVLNPPSREKQTADEPASFRKPRAFRLKQATQNAAFRFPKRHAGDSKAYAPLAILSGPRMA